MRIYFDSDGTLANFDAGVQTLLGTTPDKYMDAHGVPAFWNALAADTVGGGFYQALPMMPGASEMMAATASKRPLILSGCPLGNWAQAQKINWAADHFPGIPMICCPTKDKPLFCDPGDILIDDSAKNGPPWEAAGGTFIHFTGADAALEALRKMGVI